MTTTANETTLAFIEVTQIAPDPLNPRKTFDPEAHEQLVQSIRQHGVQVPLRLQPNDEGNGYIIVAGERRWRAAAEAGLDRVPAIVVTTQTTIGVEALVENLVREDLNPIEEGDAYLGLQEAGKDISEIAALVSRPESRIVQRARLARLPELARQALIESKVTIGDVLPLAELAEIMPQLATALAFAADYGNSWRGINQPWQMYFNLDRTFTGARTEPCETCGGEGGIEDGDEWTPCEACDGSGDIAVPTEEVEVPEFFAWPTGGYGSVPMLAMQVRQLEPAARERMVAAIERATAHYEEKRGKGGYIDRPPAPLIDNDLRDVARAAGVVVDIAHGQVITDPLWVSEYVPDAYEADVERYINPKSAPRKKKSSAEGGEQGGMGDEEREQRAKEREEAKAARAKARKLNEDLGIQIQQSLGEVPVTLEAMKLLVRTILDHTKSSDYNGLRGSGHALFQRFTGVVPTETTKSGDLKVARSAEDRAAFVKAAYERADKELSRAKTPEQALAVLVRFLAHGLADLSGLPNADLNEMMPYRAEGWRKFVLGKFPAAFRRRVPKENNISGRSYAWRD